MTATELAMKAGGAEGETKTDPSPNTTIDKDASDNADSLLGQLEKGVAKHALDLGGGATADDDDEGGGEAKGDTDEDDDKPTDEQKANAKSALLRDGWDEDFVDGMDETQLLAMGEKVAKRQGDIDTKLQEANTLLKTAQEAGATAGDSQSQDGVGDTAAPEVNLEELLKPIADDWGADAAGAISKAVTEFTTAAVAAATKDVQAMQVNAGHQSKLVDDLAMDVAQARVMVEHPHLADKMDRFGTVRQRAMELLGQDSFLKGLTGDGAFKAASSARGYMAMFDAAFNKAVGEEFATEIAKVEAERKTKAKAARKNAKPTTSTPQDDTSDVSHLNQEQREDRFLALLDEGVPRAEAAKRAGMEL